MWHASCMGSGVSNHQHGLNRQHSLQAWLFCGLELALYQRGKCSLSLSFGNLSPGLPLPHLPNKAEVGLSFSTGPGELRS